MPRRTNTNRTAKSKKPSPNLKQNQAKIKMNQKYAEKAAKADMPKTPKVKDKWERAAEKSKAKRIAARAATDSSRKALVKVEAPKVDAPKTKGGSKSQAPSDVDKRVYDPARGKKTSVGEKVRRVGSKVAKGAKAAGRLAARASLPAAVATTGYQVGKAIGERYAEEKNRRSRDAKMREAKAMIESSFTSHKKSREDGKKTKAMAGEMAPRSKVSKSSGKKNAPSTTIPSNVSAKKTTDQKRSKGAVVQEGPSRPPVKASEKKNRGYSNYQRVMSAEGLKDGGVVKKSKGYAMGGMVPDFIANTGKAVAKEAIKRYKKQTNAPKASAADSPKAVQKKKTDPSGRRDLVSPDMMNEIRRDMGVKGYAGGGMVEGKKQDMYGTYGAGCKDVSGHKVISGTRNIKYNK